MGHYKNYYYINYLLKDRSNYYSYQRHRNSSNFIHQIEQLFHYSMIKGNNLLIFN